MSWWKTAKVGDKVVCIRDAPWFWPRDQREFMVRGKIYEIAELQAHGEWVFLNLIGCGDFFSHQGFRPVQPKSTETGLAIIRKILDQAPVRETVDG